MKPVAKAKINARRRKEWRIFFICLKFRIAPLAKREE
jgi:hypothetical protein